MTAFSELKLETSPDVYAPSDDTELLASAVRKLASGRVLDLGCGTGAVGIAAAKKESVATVTCSDVNPAAVALAQKNALANGVREKMGFEVGDLFSPFPSPTVFDVIAFNPPYLPTAKEDVVIGSLNAAFDGGVDGRAVTSRFLAGFGGFLSQSGTVLLVQSSLSGIDESLREFRAKRFDADIISSKRFFFEELAVIRATAAAKPGLETGL